MTAEPRPDGPRPRKADAKPLQGKAYGSIPHLPGSRLGAGDHHCHPGQEEIATRQARRGDRVWVTEKLDGSCVAVANVDGAIVPMIRAGYRARDSHRAMHHLFHDWAMARESAFRGLLAIGERCVGEWLAVAHGTRYTLPRGPFVAFDLIRGQQRLPWHEARERLIVSGLPTPRVLDWSHAAMSIEEAMARLAPDAGGSFDGALDPVEGAVWRVETDGAFNFITKYVRPDKVDGCYLPGAPGSTATEETWNWRP